MFTWNAINTLSHDSHELRIQIPRGGPEKPHGSFCWLELLLLYLFTLPEAVAT